MDLREIIVIINIITGNGETYKYSMENLDIAKRPKEPLGNWQAIDVFLFKNGQRDAPPRKYHLTQNDLCFWNQTLKSVAEIPNDIEHSLELYKLNGQKIGGPLELQHGAAYVVVHSNERFRDSGYETYLVQASRSMEKRLKQTNKNTVNSVPPLNKIAAKKNSKIKAYNNTLQTEHTKDKETKCKTPNVTQISNVSHKPAWPGKRKEDTSVPKVTRPPSPIRRRASPIKKTRTQRRESPTTNPSKTGMVSLTKRDATPEGVQSYESNIGQLADIFRDMDIKKNLENDNPRLLIMLNDKKVISKVDVGMQVLVVNTDDGTDPPINLVEFDDKGNQKPSNTSVCRNYAKDSYVALMQPDGSIQLTIKVSSTGDGVTTEITDKNNVEMIKLDDNANDDKIAEFRIDTSMAGKVIIDTKVVKIIAIRCVSNDIQTKEQKNSTTENYITRLIENEQLENNHIPLQTQHQQISGQETITEKSSKNTIADTIINSSNSNAVETRYTSNHEEKVLNKDRNEVDEKSLRRVSVCVDKREKSESELTDKRISLNEDGEPITILEAGNKVMDYASRKFSLTIENMLQKPSDGTGISSASLPQHEFKSCNVIDGSSIAKTLPAENSENSKETNTINRSQAERTTKKQNNSEIVTKKDYSRFNSTNTHSGVERNCDYCSHNPPPCTPYCTPMASVTPAVSESDAEVCCLCHGPMDKFCQYIQTDSCEVLLMVRRNLEDSQFSFHFPTIKDLKDYRLI